eukprot:14028499-Heterocapsa_arctica.AAC.1
MVCLAHAAHRLCDLLADVELVREVDLALRGGFDHGVDLSTSDAVEPSAVDVPQGRSCRLQLVVAEPDRCDMVVGPR